MYGKVEILRECLPIEWECRSAKRFCHSLAGSYQKTLDPSSYLESSENLLFFSTHLRILVLSAPWCQQAFGDSPKSRDNEHDDSPKLFPFVPLLCYSVISGNSITKHSMLSQTKGVQHASTNGGACGVVSPNSACTFSSWLATEPIVSSHSTPVVQ